MIKTIITLLFLASVAYSAQVNTLQDKPSFVCHFNELDGTSVVATTGTVLIGITNGAWITGKFGNGIYLTGTDTTGLTVTGMNYTQESTDFLVSIWVKSETNPTSANYGFIARLTGVSAFNNYGWRINCYSNPGTDYTISYNVTIGGNLNKNSSDRQTPYTGQPSSYTTGKWTQVAFYFKGTDFGGTGKADIFVNGEMNTNYPPGYDNGYTVAHIDNYGNEVVKLGKNDFNGENLYNNGGYSYDDLIIINNVSTLNRASAIIKQIYTQGRGQND